MTKSVTLKVKGSAGAVIGYDANTMVTFQISYNPHHEKGPEPEYSIYCHGFEWGDSCYSIDFMHKEVKEGDSIELVFGGKEPPTVQGTKRLVVDEKRCLFCQKLSSEVEWLFEKDLFARICSECIEACTSDLNARRA